MMSTFQQVEEITSGCGTLSSLAITGVSIVQNLILFCYNAW